MKFIQKKKIMNILEETTRLIESKTRLEESAIRHMIHTEVNKPTKRDVQRTLSTDLIIQSAWCKIITENENKQENNQKNKQQ